MTQSTGIEHRIPEWDTADCMRKALRFSEVGVQEMADYLGVSRNTVGTWINGRVAPSKQTLRLWALRTGVPFEWLQTGKAGNPRPDTDPDGGLDATCAHRDSNPGPSDQGPRVADLHFFPSIAEPVAA